MNGKGYELITAVIPDKVLPRVEGDEHVSMVQIELTDEARLKVIMYRLGEAGLLAGQGPLPEDDIPQLELLTTSYDATGGSRKSGYPKIAHFVDHNSGQS